MKKGKVNRFGLPRYVPADTAREVRQRCGFGCVICGKAFYDIEHFSPDFKDATEHNPSGMTLLCMQCNQKRARGTLSVETVVRANASPKCLSDGFASEIFDIGYEELSIVFAGVTFKNCRNLIAINNEPILSIARPIQHGMPFLLSGVFNDESGREILRINENQFSVISESWDVEVKGCSITVRSALGDVQLVLRVVPPKLVIVEKIKMRFKSIFLDGNEDELRISTDWGKGWNKFYGCNLDGCETGIAINDGVANDSTY